MQKMGFFRRYVTAPNPVSVVLLFGYWLFQSIAHTPVGLLISFLDGLPLIKVCVMAVATVGLAAVALERLLVMPAWKAWVIAVGMEIIILTLTLYGAGWFTGHERAVFGALALLLMYIAPLFTEECDSMLRPRGKK